MTRPRTCWTSAWNGNSVEGEASLVFSVGAVVMAFRFYRLSTPRPQDKGRPTPVRTIAQDPCRFLDGRTLKPGLRRWCGAEGGVPPARREVAKESLSRPSPPRAVPQRAARALRGAR